MARQGFEPGLWFTDMPFNIPGHSLPTQLLRPGSQALRQPGCVPAFGATSSRAIPAPPASPLPGGLPGLPGKASQLEPPGTLPECLSCGSFASRAPARHKAGSQRQGESQLLPCRVCRHWRPSLESERTCWRSGVTQGEGGSSRPQVWRRVDCLLADCCPSQSCLQAEGWGAGRASWVEDIFSVIVILERGVWEVRERLCGHEGAAGKALEETSSSGVHRGRQTQSEAQRGLRETGGKPGLCFRTSGPGAHTHQAAFPSAPAQPEWRSQTLEEYLGVQNSPCA